uniref:LAGLIDADG homing endonuclease n=1 Tax=Xylochloris irregularis TaxID=480381 RepID=A0A097KMF7_9CHLO|nr:LAGLIDADG homing endonuclease [Xylochloris irregularis]AIT94363.1 LAGLIDADG homing endonuclease [Xylochloris irregularis]
MINEGIKKTEDLLQPKIGSSETTRESPVSSSVAFDSSRITFDFADFIKHHLPTHKKDVDISFLEWLVGFVEGNGRFCSRLVEEGSLKRHFLFQICQQDPKVLYKIRGHLGFGTVRKHYELTEHWRYTIEDRKGLQRIMALFNGNLVLPKRRRQFANWIKETEPIHHPSFVFKGQQTVPTVSLHTGWLSGFIDAEGCFYAPFTKPYTLSARLTQKDVCGEREVLIEIGSLFTSHVEVNLAKKSDCYHLELSSPGSHDALVDYLKRFPLHQKAVIYRRWWRVYLLRKEGRHLTEAGISRMRRVCLAIQEEREKREEFRKQLKKEGLKI